VGYDVSLEKAWDAVKGLSKEGKICIKFLNDEYEIDFSKETVLSMSCNIEAKPYYKILILHYIANENKVLGIEGDAWISFKEMEGGEVYFPAFRKRAIEPILRKYQDSPRSISERAASLDTEQMEMGNASIVIKVFSKVKAGIILWAQDDEFDAECNMVFNRSIKNIFPTEDVAVLGGIIASLI